MGDVICAQATSHRACGERLTMNILIPVDGSPYSDAALAFMAARPFKDGHHPQIDLLNVQRPLPPRAGRAVGAEWARSHGTSPSRARS